jgi:LAO/AO transport system kinase
VGQSEVEIAGLADCTVVALVPEAGDTVQTMKAGLLEIADVFVVNKADREGSDAMILALKILAHEKQRDGAETPVIATSATTGAGLQELSAAIHASLQSAGSNEGRRLRLLTEKTIQLIRLARMQDMRRTDVEAMLKQALTSPSFNLYRFAQGLAAGEALQSAG